MQRLVPWSARYTTDEYIAFLNTHSDKRMLPDQQRAALFDAIRESLDAAGGVIEHPYVAELVAAPVVGAVQRRGLVEQPVQDQQDLGGEVGDSSEFWKTIVSSGTVEVVARGSRERDVGVRVVDQPKQRALLRHQRLAVGAHLRDLDADVLGVEQSGSMPAASALRACQAGCRVARGR